MIALVQRVSSASVTCEGVVTASIGTGLLVLLGIEEADGSEDIAWLAPKVANLRIFPDENGVMNVSLKDMIPATESLASVREASSFEGTTFHAEHAKSNEVAASEQSKGLPPPWGGAGFEGALASEKTGAGIVPSLELSPEQHPLGSGGEGASVSSPREGPDCIAPLASLREASCFEETTLTRFASSPTSPCKQGEVSSSPELGSVHPPHPSPLPLGSGGEGVLNSSPREVAGAIVVSQFTLHASTKKGNRPSYIRAARPEHAEPLYAAFADALSRELGQPVGTGVFGGDMKVALVNDGPVTIHIDTKNRV